MSIFDSFTDSTGLSTDETRFDREAYYYFNVSYPGYTSNNSDNWYNPDNYGQIEDEYTLFPIPNVITVNLTWSNARDFDFYVIASDNDYFYRNADRMTAPGGETYTLSSLHGGETLLAYAYFFSNEVSLSTANPTVTFAADGTVYDIVSFNNATQPSGYRYWLAACFDANENVIVIDQAFASAPTISDCYQ